MLSAGLAGPGRRRDGRTVVYDEAAVERLLERPVCPRQTLDDVRPIVARLGRGRAVRIDEPWDRIAASVSSGWYVPLLISLALHAPRDDQAIRQPFVATLASWVVFGGEITAARFEASSTPRPKNRTSAQQTFELAPPGPWFDQISGTWLPLDANSPTLTWWGAPTTTPDGADSLSADYDEQVRRAADERAARSAATVRALIQETTPGLAAEPQPVNGPTAADERDW